MGWRYVRSVLADFEPLEPQLKGKEFGFDRAGLDESLLQACCAALLLVLAVGAPVYVEGWPPPADSLWLTAILGVPGVLCLCWWSAAFFRGERLRIDEDEIVYEQRGLIFRKEFWSPKTEARIAWGYVLASTGRAHGCGMGLVLVIPGAKVVVWCTDRIDGFAETARWLGERWGIGVDDHESRMILPAL